MKDYNYTNPDHYKNADLEVWEMMVAIWGKEAFIQYCQMNAFKYRMRLGLKPGEPVERELQKARWYEEKAAALKKDM